MNVTAPSDAPTETETLERRFLRLTLKNWLRLTALVALVAIVVVAFVVFDAEEKLEDLLEWIDDNPAPGFFIFVLAYCLATGIPRRGILQRGWMQCSLYLG